MEIKIDPFTKEEFYPKRKNQIFASEQNKIDFHNEQARNDRFLKKEIDFKITKNYKILKSFLIDQSEIKVDKIEMTREGFDFRFINHFTKDYYEGIIIQFLGIYNIQYAMLGTKKETILIQKIN